MSWTDAPSKPQADLIRKLGGDPTLCETRREASDLIGQLQASAKQGQATTPDPALTVGVYEVDGTIYIVRPTREDKSRLYAKRLTETGGTRLTEAGVRVPEIDFQYERGAIYKIKPEHRMDVERAKALTARYGRCIVCGRHLKAAESVERGIGPVCIKSFRGPAPATVGGENALGQTWTSDGDVLLAQPAAMRVARREAEQTIDMRASAARDLFAQALGCLRLETDVSVDDCDAALRTFDVLVEGYER